jgi:hypothetical protein
MKRFFFILSSVSVLSLQAQNEVDVLRYSFTGFGGTARFNAMGGSFGALGGDLSAITINPAGIGLYRRSELVFTPSLFSQRVTSTYNGTANDDNRTNFRIENFGIVIGGKNDNTNEHGWQSFALGITYNRYQSYQANLFMQGRASSSQADAWSNSANGKGPSGLNPFAEGLAWNAYLLNTLPNDTTRYNDTIPDGVFVDQEKRIQQRGGMGEWSFSFGGNYSEKLFVGVTLNLPSIRYEESSTYTEEVNDSISDFKNFAYNQSLSTRGNGFNLRVGLIYRPIDLVRFGFSVQTPTILRMSDDFSASMQSLIGGRVFEVSSPLGEYDYTIRTPLRATGSIAFIIGKKGAINMDYEYVDYSDGRLRANDYGFSDENNAVRNKYRVGQNIRVGGELRLKPISLRGGMAYYSNPYAENVNNETTRISITGGIGYRDPEDRFYFDFALINTRMTENYYFYTPELTSPVKNEWRSTNGVLTVGFKF